MKREIQNIGSGYLLTIQKITTRSGKDVYGYKWSGGRNLRNEKNCRNRTANHNTRNCACNQWKNSHWSEPGRDF